MTSLARLVTSAPKASTSVMTHMHMASSNPSDCASPSGRPTDFTAATLRIARHLLGQHFSHMVWVPRVLPTSDAWLQLWPSCPVSPFLGVCWVESHELRDAGFLEHLGGALIWTPSDTRSTCTTPPFRLLDYAVISPSFQVLAGSMTAVHDLPQHAHLRLEITLRDDSSEECDRDSGRRINADALMAELFDNPKQEDRQVEDGSSPRMSDPEEERERELLEQFGLPEETPTQEQNTRSLHGWSWAKDGWSWAKDGWSWRSWQFVQLRDNSQFSGN